MTREIKFRGRSNYGNWCEGNLLIDPNGNYFIESYDKRGVRSVVLVEKETVSQYTGLKDKAGKEVYEGDILSNGGIPGRVEWDSLLLHFHCAWADFDFKTAGDISYLIRSNYVAIGNIHDNPELLNQ